MASFCSASWFQTTQSKAARTYTDDLAEILHAVAMVIAELAVGSSIVDLFEITGGEHPMLQSQQLSGITLAGGIAKAPIVLHRPKIEIDKLEIGRAHV